MNQKQSSRVTSKVYVDRSSIQGMGVFAAVEIGQGEVILAIDDLRKVTIDRPLHSEAGEYDIHCDYLADGVVVLMRYPERHINHGCAPNTYVKSLLGVRYVFALHPIYADEEITYDYCINGFGSVIWECNCGSRDCRHTIHSDFFHLPENLQVKYLPLLDEWYVRAYRPQVEDLIRRAMDREGL